MARKMDSMKAEIDKLKVLNESIAASEKRIREVKKERDGLKELLLTKMQSSIEAEVDGKLVFKITEAERSSVTISRVMEFAPQLADKLIVKSISKNIKFV